MIPILIVFLPLLGAFIASLGVWCVIHRQILQICTSILMVTSMLLSWYLLTTMDGINSLIHLIPWINLGSFVVNWALYIDSLTILMFIVVTTVSSVVHIYSIGYMHNDPDVLRFFAYISLFTFCMLILVSSSNFVQMFFGWEGVGLCSYLLIGFWFKKNSANSAAMKAFIVNRVGDFGLLIGMALVYYVFDSMNFIDVLSNVESYQQHSTFGAHTLSVICFLLFFGCMGKSAQIGLHTWLPDAMEGPTPVSALIHAATMVTAGVFLLSRLSPLFELAPAARSFILFVGTATCLMAATVALVQQDIKKIIAYSTCSQLGYMFIACGLSAYGVAMFHLVTHAFFKALLFLCAGNVIHSMHGEQNINKMSSHLWKKIPITYALMWIASLALAGIFPFAGFYSKDLILEIAHSSNFAFAIGILVVSLTAFYSWRLIIKVFHNNNEACMKNICESPKVMLLPLYLLALFSIISGFIGEHLLHISGNDFWHGSISPIKIPHINWLDQALPILFSLSGIIIAYLIISKSFCSQQSIKNHLIPFMLLLLDALLFRDHLIIATCVGLLLLLIFFSSKTQHILCNLARKKYYFDEAYDWLFVRGIKLVSYTLWKAIDICFIDKFGPKGIADASYKLSLYVTRLHTGLIYDYTFSMLLGIVSIIGLFVYLL